MPTPRRSDVAARAPGAGARAAAALAAAALAAGAAPARASGPPVFVSADAAADPALVRQVREVVASRRAIRESLALPPPESVSPERAAMEQRAASIRLALGRAARLESEASFAECVREAAGALSDATSVLAKSGDLALLRDLHLQIGACMTLSQDGGSARPHFVAAALLDETPPRAGLHREEAERASAEARAEVLARSRGKVRIETTPPGAEVWIDGRKAAGATPLEVDVRLGDHFVTARRFRFEPHTERAVLQPSGVVRIALDPAQRATLREQLAALPPAGAARPGGDELLLARAAWSRAEQAVAIAGAGAGRARVRVIDVATGQPLRAADADLASGGDALRRAVCDALGETCEVKPRGAPWYVWPLAGAAVVGGVVSAALLVNAGRDYRFCPPSGCR